MGAEACLLCAGPTLLALGSAAAALQDGDSEAAAAFQEPLYRAMCSERVLGVSGALNRHLHIQTARAV